MHDLLRLYAQRLSDDHADADGREQARDRLLGYYLRHGRCAADHLRALPGHGGAGRIHRPGAPWPGWMRNGPAWWPRSAWLRTPAGTRLALRLPFGWPSTLTGGAGSTTGWHYDQSAWTLPGASATGTEGEALTTSASPCGSAAVRGGDHRLPGRGRHLPGNR